MNDRKESMYLLSLKRASKNTDKAHLFLYYYNLVSFKRILELNRPSKLNLRMVIAGRDSMFLGLPIGILYRLKRSSPPFPLNKL